METLTIEEAAALLKMHPDTLSAQAKAGEVPAAKLGRRWVFVKSDLIEHIRSKYKTEEKASPPSSYELPSISLKSAAQIQANALDFLRAHRTKKKRSATPTR